MSQSKADTSDSPPGYRLVATVSVSSTRLVGRGSALAHLGDGHAVIVTSDGSTTVKVPGLAKKTATCLDVALVDGRPEIVVGFTDGSVEVVSGSRGPPVAYRRPKEDGRSPNTIECVAVAWMPDGGAQELVVVYRDGAVARFGRTSGTSGASSDDKCVAFWDVDLTMDAMGTIRTNECVVAAALSPCLDAHGRCLVALASSAGRLRIFDAGDGATLGGCSTFFGGFTCVAFSRDGLYVAAGGEDDMVTLARVGSVIAAVHCQGHTSWPTAVAFETMPSRGPSIVRLWSVGLDGKVCAFEVQADDFPPADQVVARCARKSDLCPVAPEFCVKISGEPLRAIAMAEGGLLAISTRRLVMRFSAVAPPPAASRGAPLRVESAKLFQKQWHVYRTVLENNELCHMDTIESIARDFTMSGAPGPRRVLDIGCGDGAVFSAVLDKMEEEGHRVGLAHYTGVDASRAALDLNDVRAEKKDLVEMELERYLEVERDQTYDSILANLILHHFDETGKRRIVRQIAGLLAHGGTFYYGDVYDTHPGAFDLIKPTCQLAGAIVDNTHVCLPHPLTNSPARLLDLASLLQGLVERHSLTAGKFGWTDTWVSRRMTLHRFGRYVSPPTRTHTHAHTHAHTHTHATDSRPFAACCRERLPQQLGFHERDPQGGGP